MGALPGDRIKVWTDGSCFPNPGIGGWAYLIRHPDGREIENTGSMREATNNRMEMMAVLMAMAALPQWSCPVIHTDSTYVIDGFRIEKRRRRQQYNFRTMAGETKNADLWRLMYVEQDRVQPTFTWVRGHVGIPENERCDVLAGQERERLEARLLNAYDPRHVGHLKEILRT